ncbi:MAG: helix-turn-helix domain-containing protein, partial [Candidatus Binataceae bacterium]
ENYAWPGNVRELQNEIERAVALTPSGENIKAESLSNQIRSRSNLLSAASDAPSASPAPAPAPPPSESADLRFARADFEMRYIAKVLASNQGNISRSAKMLGISRISLQRKIKEYNIR